MMNDEHEFNPNWLPTHPLNTLFDKIDEDPDAVLFRLEQILSESERQGKDQYYLDSIRYLSYFIKGYGREIEILSKICGSEEFWKKRYDNYWAKRK